MQLTKSEMEIMEVFWASETPLSRADLLELSTGKTWKDSSVHIMLNGLLNKGVLEAVGFVKRNRTYGRVFAPSMTKEAYFINLAFCRKPQPVVAKMFSELLNNPATTMEDVEALEQMIAEKKAAAAAAE